MTGEIDSAELDALAIAAPSVDAGPTAAPTGEAGAQAPGAPTGAPQVDPLQHKANADFMVAMVAGALAVATGVPLVPSERAQLAEDLAPVLAKYGGVMPPWLERWKEELTLAKTAGMVGFAVYQRMQLEAARRAAAERPKPDASPTPASPAPA